LFFTLVLSAIPGMVVEEYDDSHDDVVGADPRCQVCGQVRETTLPGPTSGLVQRIPSDSERLISFGQRPRAREAPRTPLGGRVALHQITALW
jgi:hypothetical protein